jgi:hypothetical protein
MLYAEGLLHRTDLASLLEVPREAAKEITSAIPSPHRE